ncbi:RNA 2'-phosphotransferase [Bifidobacterium leontopitheci]|uniref:Probable RNA 2'-phosphotransferase n=1 Tax=Bifidobacterium leontopitheci TaxID=2650774 RepID=A0A6I1GEI6_9BIFI|nr:RNA 2'-phosphotransferase [Bifidobacterium leontopitheci]KAB7790053.1 RNA 2'-phosphotransferase [Bifidobacterium leontopitheci]
MQRDAQRGRQDAAPDRLTHISKYMSLILRHKPEVVGITLDRHGWADMDALIAGIGREYPTFDRAMLEEIVRTDSKQRYSFSEDGTKIRANQGHSIPVDVELPETEPPQMLYHGTARRFTASINANGLLPQSRLYVHLSLDEQTAKKVGRRHGDPAVYLVDAARMRRDGHVFYRSVNGVWLTRTVPARYLQRVE